MTEGNFVDFVKITISSGNGGKGSVHLRREKFVAKGGPDGGDGGRGGHVIIRANTNLWTLYPFKFKKHFSAGHGESGGKSRSSGAQGEDVFIDVPLGTVVKNAENQEILFEITEKNQEDIVLKGGLGGRGNWHFKSATRQTPRYAQSGLEGSSIQLTLELKVLADVGLVGFPNAGKSSLINLLLKQKISIVSNKVQTTNENIQAVLSYKDCDIVFTDTPGVIDKKQFYDKKITRKTHVLNLIKLIV